MVDQGREYVRKIGTAVIASLLVVYGCVVAFNWVTTSPECRTVQHVVPVDEGGKGSPTPAQYEACERTK